MLNLVLRGDMTVGEAAETMQLSVRHTRRILAAYRKEGARAVIHGNRGRQPRHTIDEQQRAQVIRLARDTYADLNDSHLTEVLAEQEGIILSRSSVRRIRREAGLTNAEAGSHQHPNGASLSILLVRTIGTKGIY